jgi:hypothetical protein
MESKAVVRDRAAFDSVTLPRIRSSQTIRSAESVSARQTRPVGAPIVVDNATVINEIVAPRPKECGLEPVGASAAALAGFPRALALPYSSSAEPTMQFRPRFLARSSAARALDAVLPGVCSGLADTEKRTP